MSRLARVSPEEIENISNRIGGMGRDMRPSNGWDDPDELREEEIWEESEFPGGRDGSDHYVKEDFNVMQQSFKERGSSPKATKSRKSLLTMELQASSRNGDYDSPQNGHGVAQVDDWNTVASSKNNDWIDNRRVIDRCVPQSAPVSVPIWLRRHGGENDDSSNNNGHCCASNGYDNEEDDEFDDSVNDDKGRRGRRLPPHEIVAREYARSQATTFSVCEGAGRTLKGMDLRRVRNAVWSRTGFVD